MTTASSSSFQVPEQHTTQENRYRYRNAMRMLLRFYDGEAGRLLLALVLYCIKHSGVWIMPLVTAILIDVVSMPAQYPISRLYWYGGLMIFLYVQNLPMHTLYVHVFSSVNRKVEARLRSTVAWRLQHLSMHFHFRTGTGALQAKLLRDVEMIEQLTRQLFETVPITVISLLIALVATAVRAPIFLLFFLLVVPLVLWIVQALQEPIEVRNRTFRQNVEKLASRLTEMVQLIPVTRAHGVEHVEMRRLDERLEEVKESGTRLDIINGFFGAGAWVVLMVANAVCLLISAYFAYTGRFNISAGDVVLLTGYFASITNMAAQLLNMMPQIAKGFESVYSLAEVLESPDLERNEGKPAVENVRGAFELRDVTFAYPDEDQHALHGITLQVEPGETVAFVGSSGAGKSTLLNLLIGFIRPTSGQILLDGQDFEDLDLRTYRRHLSVVAQHTILFEGTIRENVLYGVEAPTEAVLWQALRDANADDFIRALPDGLDTMIGENGARLSGGQRQRIAIARALIRDPRVLILDEATSALDTFTELLIQEALERLMRNRTTFIVAHRLSTIRHAERIFVMEQGRIVEVGSHDELLRRDGPYARLHGLRHVG